MPTNNEEFITPQAIVADQLMKAQKPLDIASTFMATGLGGYMPNVPVNYSLQLMPQAPIMPKAPRTPNLNKDNNLILGGSK